MIYAKTPAGQHAFTTRAPTLTSKLRIAYLMVDGARHRTDILTATAGMGVSKDDLDRLITLGYIETQATTALPVVEGRRADFSPEQQVVIFMAAVKQATALTANMGLRGFRLNLAVESAQNLEELEALLPQMMAALGSDAVAPLQRLLSHA
jgi:hypothetical protein